ncbi:MAG TPA: Rdx family protein [Phycisphaerae bacterium]|nr:Rdx family protein [Phycisphaerae bacterium]
MAADIKKYIGVDCKLIAGKGGIFDVHVNGDLIYSKHQTGEFPEHLPLIKQIQDSHSA